MTHISPRVRSNALFASPTSYRSCRARMRTIGSFYVLRQVPQSGVLAEADRRAQSGCAYLMLSPCGRWLLSPEMGRKGATTQRRLSNECPRPGDPKPERRDRPFQAVALAFYHARRIQRARGRTQGTVSPSCRVRHGHRLKKSCPGPNVRGSEQNNRRNEFDPAIGAAAQRANLGNTMKGIAEWLASIGLEEYAQRFAENAIDLSVLRDLTEQDLKDLGVLLGHRRKFLRAIAELEGVPPAPTDTAIRPALREEAERRHLTVMICDLVGSTALSARLDP